MSKRPTAHDDDRSSYHWGPASVPLGVNRNSMISTQTGGMNANLSVVVELVARAGAVLLVANEVRGLVLTAPVFYGLYAAGGTAMAAWLAFCSLGGIALSVVVPLFVARRIQKVLPHRKEGLGASSPF